MVMSKRKKLILLGLITAMAFAAAGCIRTIPKPGGNIPGNGVKLSGVVVFKNTQLPIYNATVRVGDKTATTDGYGAFEITGISPGQYDIRVITAAGDHDERVDLSKNSVLTIKVNEPYGFHDRVFVDLSRINSPTGITRWGADSEIKYYFSGGDPDEHALFEEALANFLQATELQGNVLRVSRTTSRLDANVVIEWEALSENVMAKVDNTVKNGRITYSNIKIYDMPEIRSKRLPYQIAVARMLGLSGETDHDRNSVLWHESANLNGPEMNKTASATDRAAVMVLYSLEPGFRSDVK